MVAGNKLPTIHDSAVEDAHVIFLKPVLPEELKQNQAKIIDIHTSTSSSSSSWPLSTSLSFDCHHHYLHHCISSLSSSWPLSTSLSFDCRHHYLHHCQYHDKQS